jgi:uncharacterized protein YktB (UPF0637 family)
MVAIQERIQPKFKTLGLELAAQLSADSGDEMHLHIARHARRKVNPPKDTWLAICSNKRGYKSHPHFQLGLFDDHLFVWLAFIYEVPGKAGIASALLNQLDDVIAAVPGSYVVSMDHMQKMATPVSDMSKQDWSDALVRFRDVKKSELLIGRHVAADDPLLGDGTALLRFASETFESLLPLYRLGHV